MADFAEIARRRARLGARSDYLRLRLNVHYEQLRPAVVWIEQGYSLAQALSDSQERPAASWTERIVAILKGN